MNLKKRRDLKHFSEWLKENGLIRDDLIPYELAELYLESEFYKKNKNRKH